LLSGTCLTSYEKNISFIDLGGRGRDANVKRSTGVARSDHGYATNFETQGGPEPGFAAAKGSADAGHNSKQSWA
jgi:hypothetical protein